jgi:REP element-mobilizing transposase RayT
MPQSTKRDAREPGSPNPGGVRFYRHDGSLPHYDAGVVPQSFTFRLADSIPRVVLARWAVELASLPRDQFTDTRRRRIEAYLDRGLGDALLGNPAAAKVVVDALRLFDKVRYDLHAWCVMPNHCHVVVTPYEGVKVADLAYTWKVGTARRINVALGRTGSLWQKDYFDRMIRGPEHLRSAVAYIHGNPVKAGLVTSAEAWHWSSASGGAAMDAGTRRFGDVRALAARVQ